MTRRLCLLLSITFSLYYGLTMAHAGVCTDWTADINAGVVEAPFAYRLLTPSLLVATGNSTGSQVVFLLLMTAVFLILLDAYCARLFLPPVCTVLVALMLPVAFETWYCSQYEITEVNLLLCGLLLLTRRWSSSAHLTGK